MPKVAIERTPEQQKIYDVVNDKIGRIYGNISEHQALNLAIYSMLDDITDTVNIDTRKNLNKVLALLNIQEDRLKLLYSYVDDTSKELLDIIG